MGGKVVVVAYLNFVCCYGIVLVTDGKNLTCPGSCSACRALMKRSRSVSGMGQQHLGYGDIVRLQCFGPTTHQFGLSRGGKCLELR